VITPKMNGTAIEDDLLEASIVYIPLYIGCVFLSGIFLTAMGVDGLTAFSGSAAAMGNVGPGFGTVGSMGNFSQIPEPGKWLLTATMLMGRLEIFGLILFLTVRSWR
jgi:trk system potassium uptake protein TrkH